MTTLYYFGDKYYDKSKTMMGVLYSDDGKRSDWGFVQRDLRNGETVTIRPATPKMIAWADEQLKEWVTE